MLIYVERSSKSRTEISCLAFDQNGMRKITRIPLVHIILTTPFYSVTFSRGNRAGNLAKMCKSRTWLI